MYRVKTTFPCLAFYDAAEQKAKPIIKFGFKVGDKVDVVDDDANQCCQGVVRSVTQTGHPGFMFYLVHIYGSEDVSDRWISDADFKIFPRHTMTLNMVCDENGQPLGAEDKVQIYSSIKPTWQEAQIVNVTNSHYLIASPPDGRLVKYVEQQLHYVTAMPQNAASPVVSRASEMVLPGTSTALSADAKTLGVNSQIDVQDTYGDWCCAVIKQDLIDKWLVTFPGFPVRYDEKICKSSHRIQTRHKYTRKSFVDSCGRTGKVGDEVEFRCLFSNFVHRATVVATKKCDLLDKGIALDMKCTGGTLPLCTFNTDSFQWIDERMVRMIQPSVCGCSDVAATTPPDAATTPPDAATTPASSATTPPDAATTPASSATTPPAPLPVEATTAQPCSPVFPSVQGFGLTLSINSPIDALDKHSRWYCGVIKADLGDRWLVTFPGYHSQSDEEILKSSDRIQPRHTETHESFVDFHGRVGKIGDEVDHRCCYCEYNTWHRGTVIATWSRKRYNSAVALASTCKRTLRTYFWSSPSEVMVVATPPDTATPVTTPEVTVTSEDPVVVTTLKATVVGISPQATVVVTPPEVAVVVTSPEAPVVPTPREAPVVGISPQATAVVTPPLAVVATTPEAPVVPTPREAPVIVTPKPVLATGGFVAVVTPAAETILTTAASTNTPDTPATATPVPTTAPICSGVQGFGLTLSVNSPIDALDKRKNWYCGVITADLGDRWLVTFPGFRNRSDEEIFKSSDRIQPRHTQTQDSFVDKSGKFGKVGDKVEYACACGQFHQTTVLATLSRSRQDQRVALAVVCEHTFSGFDWVSSSMMHLVIENPTSAVVVTTPEATVVATTPEATAVATTPAVTGLKYNITTPPVTSDATLKVPTDATPALAATGAFGLTLTLNSEIDAEDKSQTWWCAVIKADLGDKWLVTYPGFSKYRDDQIVKSSDRLQPRHTKTQESFVDGGGQIGKVGDEVEYVCWCGKSHQTTVVATLSRSRQEQKVAFRVACTGMFSDFEWYTSSRVRLVKAAADSSPAVIENPTPADSSPAVIENPTPADSSPAVIENPTPANSSPAVIENPTPADSSSAVIENPTPADSSSAVIENPTPADSSSAVIENPTPADSSPTVTGDSKLPQTDESSSIVPTNLPAAKNDASNPEPNLTPEEPEVKVIYVAGPSEPLTDTVTLTHTTVSWKECQHSSLPGTVVKRGDVFYCVHCGSRCLRT
jgi:hypothetical protein